MNSWMNAVESQPTIVGVLVGLIVFTVITFGFIGWEIWNDE